MLNDRSEAELCKASKDFFLRCRAADKNSKTELFKKLHNFCRLYGAINKIAQQSWKEINKFLANDFSVFNYFSCEEMKLSAIIADLLHPFGSHGQGQLFLKMFIQRINMMLPADSHLKMERLDTTKIAREVATRCIEATQRRIDIVLENDEWILGIENKPWACEQDNQLQSYRQHLENQYRSRGIPCHILYLPGDCSLPCSDRDNYETLVMGYVWNEEICGSKFKYAHLDDWLNEASRHCRAERVRYFLHDFTVWLKKTFTVQLAAGHKETFHDHT